MNNNDISMNTSINIIYNELLQMYNNEFNNSKKTIETFSLPPIDNNTKEFFIKVSIVAKNNGYEINFTIDELENVLSYLELRANLLTLEQQEKRKKIFINVKNILIKLKESGELDKFINNLLNPHPGSIFDPSFNKALKPNFNPMTNIKPNILAFHTLLLNVVDLFIEDIDNNNKNKNNNNIIIIIIILILLGVFGYFYFYFYKK